MRSILDAIQTAKSTVLDTQKQRQREQKKRDERKAYFERNGSGTGDGENISAFIQQCNPVSEMVSSGLLVQGRGNEYKWHESEHDRSCEVLGDGVIHIYSNSMSAASPESDSAPINAHRFYLYQLTGLDMTKDADKPRLREMLFERGYGSDPKAFVKKHQTKLEVSGDFSLKEETLEADRAKQEKVTDTFLTVKSKDGATCHILLICTTTGGGKTYLIISKSRKHDKRTLAALPHSDLAVQAVEIAYQQGYKNPFHLKGREHNWLDSGIEQIPVSDRTEELFEKNNCIMADVVKEYTEKRLAPRTFCEHTCEFRDGCPHLAQYDGLGERDFVANCTPNLLFDLNMRGYLESLVTATTQPTEEDFAIDAMLGTTSEATEPFNFAIVDDYSVASLYTDVLFKASEFKKLKKVWRGTPVADFAKLILKAFEKKKPHKIVEKLQKAFESTAEHHDLIAKRLTQHARVGIVQSLEIPTHSKETQECLSEKQVCYEDGGKQFIPVSYEAYAELTEKDIPAVNPAHINIHIGHGEKVRIPHTPAAALLAGVPLADLTPVWQQGATPVELLSIFLDSLGNYQNAPISRSFLPGDPPSAVLTFTIPPQAPAGLIDKIGMLSATTDIADTKKSFTGQTVSFSEHTGGIIAWEEGVQVYQFSDARMTSGSVFDYKRNAAGERLFQEPPIGLTATAEKRIQKLNNWGKQTDGLTAFISFKEFTEAPFREYVDNFDEVKHFDDVSGLNFKGLKLLVVFGSPKAKFEAVIEQARKQYASDTEPLPQGKYKELTEIKEITEDGFKITERQYKDKRLEKIRQQLTVEKLEQAVGRARLVAWTGTQTIIFTNIPIQGITERTQLFSSAAFNLADTHNGLPDAMDRIQDAMDTGDVKAVMETQGVSERQAYELTKEIRHQRNAKRDTELLSKAKELLQDMSQRDTAKTLNMPLSNLQRLLKTE